MKYSAYGFWLESWILHSWSAVQVRRFKQKSVKSSEEMKETKLSFIQASQICGGWRVLVWVHCSTVLTAISSGGDPQGTVRNAGSEEELREALGVRGGAAHICLSAGRDEWLRDNRASAAGRKMIPVPLWQPATLAGLLRRSHRPATPTC